MVIFPCIGNIASSNVLDLLQLDKSWDLVSVLYKINEDMYV